MQTWSLKHWTAREALLIKKKQNNIHHPPDVFTTEPCSEKQPDIFQEPHLGNADLNTIFTPPDKTSYRNINRGRNVSENL